MFTEYFKCKYCGQIFRITIVNGREMNKINCYPTCGESNINYASNDEVDECFN